MRNRLSHDQFKKLLEQVINKYSPAQLEEEIKKLFSQHIHMGTYWERIVSEKQTRKFRLTINVLDTLHYREISLMVADSWTAEDVIRMAVEGGHIDNVAARLVHDVEEMSDTAQRRIFLENAGEFLSKKD